MTATAGRSEVGALSLVLPPLWQRLDVSGLLDALLDPAVDEEYQELLGAEAASQVTTALQHLRDTNGRDGVVVAAMRMRAEAKAIDILTVALPPEPREAEGGPAAEEARRESVELVDLGGSAGISHQEEAPPDSRRFFRTHVQIVTRVPPVGRGAIVTVGSSEPRAEALLETEAEAVAGSLSVEGTKSSTDPR